MQVLAWYNKALVERPFVTKSVTTFFILGAGDVLSQFIEARNAGVSLQPDWNRSLRVACYGAVYLAPAMHTWYSFLARTFPQATIASILKKTALDQTFFCTFAIGSYFLVVTRLHQGSWQHGLDKVRHSLWDTLLVNWHVWPFVIAFNFKFIPLQFQVVFVNSVAVFWNTYLSNVTNSK